MRELTPEEILRQLLEEYGSAREDCARAEADHANAIRRASELAYKIQQSYIPKKED